MADGVGGWVESGVDPSLFSQSLMYHASKYAESAWAGEPESDPSDSSPVEGWELTPKECLEQAHQGVLRDRSVKAGAHAIYIFHETYNDSTGGSSTACLIHLNARSGLLRATKSVSFVLVNAFILTVAQSRRFWFCNISWRNFASCSTTPNPFL